MTVTAIPAVTARPRLAPYTAASGDMVLPGCYGVSRGQAITGDLIRHATGPRPGHAFIYIGNGRIVEVAPPAVRIAPAASHRDAVWNAQCSLTAAQRQRICVRAHALVGRPYEYPAYTGFALKVLEPRDDTGSIRSSRRSLAASPQRWSPTSTRTRASGWSRACAI